ncbi:hypothetical protein LO763_06825 [Glycomyces sp. A-F 0318]|uniref:hypothetical protein n=1 Tax=Glycomyces amatae TaxID=2881355 RepID=UPI001E63AD77|nr:hypothetical protein [Glycomyces amatae]MCD0443338.1 hypothetical protein [Glycomyces amatae]
MTFMCRRLQVATSGYYEWRTRPESATARRRKALTAQIIRAAAQIAGGAMTFAAMATGAQLVLADGKVGVLSSLPDLRTRILVFTVEGAKVIALEGVTYPDCVRAMELTPLDA